MTAAPVLGFDAHRSPAARDIAGQRGYVLGVLAFCGVPSRDRQDVAQDVLLDAWLAIETRRFRRADADALRPYLRGIAWRHAWDYRERAHVRLEEFSPEPVPRSAPDPGPSALDSLVARETDAAVAAAVARLPRTAREAVRAAVEHDSLTGCALSLDVPVTTAFNRLRVAAERIRHALHRAERRS